jgi:hypothetical protein
LYKDPSVIVFMMLLGSRLSMLRHFLYSAPSMLNYLPFTLLMTSVVTAAITWRPCDDLPGHVQCANLTVPLDYTNCSNNQTLVLQLVRAPAVTGQSKGSILLNFGGPGATSRQSLATTNPLLHAYVWCSAAPETESLFADRNIMQHDGWST